MNTFGKNLTLTTFGESHGPAMGGVIDGFPAGFRIDFDKLYEEVAKRRPGSSALVTARNEKDFPEFLSGINPDGITLGTPIGFIVRNVDHRSGDYDEMALLYRPNHADYTYDQRYGIRDPRGGGRSSRPKFRRAKHNGGIWGFVVSQDADADYSRHSQPGTYLQVKQTWLCEFCGNDERLLERGFEFYK